MKDRTKVTGIDADPDLIERLETVRQQQKLQTIDQVMEYLVRSRIRRNGDQLFGRRRALYIAAKG